METSISGNTITYRPKPHFIKEMVIMGASVIFFGLIFLDMARRIFILKRRCTETVPAKILSIQKSKSSDGGLRFRYARYTARYRYEFNGQTYDSSNRLFGSKSALGSHGEGSTILIKIDPKDPRKVYDPFAASAMSSHLITAVMLILLGLFMIFGPFIVK
ncbi:MAG TPA: hypothetical protein DCZ62_01755 [Ruminococcus sp.]|nr:hypothetical protein [Ruminococcus sp.]